MRKRLWLVMFALLSGCGRTSTSSSDPPRTTIDSDSDSERDPVPESEQAAGAGPTTPSDEGAAGGSCVPLDATKAAPDSKDLQLEYACGFHSAERKWSSDYVQGGESCGDNIGLNTFSMRLKGAAAARYSAVVRCGYIRYDNGTFVGERVAVEARDGQWCHQPALELLQPIDRMLLTDVSFSIEPVDPGPARKQPLAVQFSTRVGWTQPVPAENPLCFYVAHREPGNWACRMVTAAPYCVCPCGEAWEDFLSDLRISLAQP